ncbi:23S rRNA (cytidine1920-2'-O)/16S rRNA (cytidine1409-2'-O)-methyltransferase [Mariprofundus ferrinatatus]|uniref:23S rRNA (Cytidine1920-2'-O)/16S rRNA (Cytidine1409-2'-O)-methyltransferase n=1 Tax=Mariprofundus ferrinatatus TaxID=1921087 RepID=A0A2K8L0V7_9PROT|nr:TlyA family RNA methyltransferase [Mariprofundus ferrinatatus]ATX80928.1 23S rRNA (cytidine1920-2'-O)/16S rRNA (cytidine1409-2'-O)-methyltransferase [Mariprofundus ferrinatatus]
MAKARKLRLDQILFERGLCDSADIASRQIMAGLVYVAGQKADKPGMQFREDAEIEVRELLPYVSRGGLKLEKALKDFPFSPKGAICLDVGASTGGFTDVLLQNGAEKVYAVDVGHGQLHYKLQNDARVINLEKTHVRKLTSELIPEPIDALVIDTSFISLTKVLPCAWPFVKAGGWCVALIKPQFEVEPKYLDRGVVREEEHRQAAIARVTAMVEAELDSTEIIGITESPIHGPKGNVEYLLGLKKRSPLN